MAKAKDTAPPPDDIQPVEPAADPKDAEIERLRAELAAAKSATPPVYAGGKKYKVSLKDAGVAVVETRPGEHPWDAFRRVSGVLSSIHQPEITEAGDDATCGHVRPNGTVEPFAPEHATTA